MFIWLVCLVSTTIPVYIGNIISPNDFNQRFDSADFPFCQNSDFLQVTSENESFFQKFNGQILNDMGLIFHFNTNAVNQSLCQRSFTPNTFSILKNAIKNNLFIQFNVYNQLTSYAPLGFIDDSSIIYFFSHWNFTFFNFQDKIVSFVVNSSDPVELNFENDIFYSYSVNWIATLQKNGVKTSQTTQTQYWHHFYSLMSISIYMIAVFSVLSVFLIQKVSTDLNAVQKDDQYDDFTNNSGFHWILLHGDIFRKPFRFIYLSSFIGASLGLICMIFLLFIALLLTDFANTFGLANIFIIMSVISSIVSGYITISLLLQYGEKKVARSLFLTSIMVSILISLFIFIFSSSFIRFISTSFFIFIMNLVLNFISGYIAPHVLVFSLPCEIAMIQRRSPNLPFLLSNNVMYPLIGSIISFLTIHEFRFLVNVLNNNDMNWFVLFSFIVFISSTIIIVIVSFLYVYVLMKVGWFQWQWKTFRACFTSGFCLLIYLIWFINIHSSFSNHLEIFQAYLFALSASIAFGLICGGIGYISVNVFLTLLFSNLKFS